MFLVSICAMDPSEGAGSVQKQLEAKRWEKSSVIFSFVGCNQARSPQIYSNLRWLCKKKHWCLCRKIQFWNVQFFFCSFYLYLKLFGFNQTSWSPSKKLFSVAKTYLECYISSLLWTQTGHSFFISQPQPFVPQVEVNMVIFWERWDGNIFFARTKGINGFSMVLALGLLNHHH